MSVKYVYTCLYATTPNGRGITYSALVAWKNFFRTRYVEDKSRVITYKIPQAILNNPGQRVFPGDELKPGENPFDGALRTFEEKTGIAFDEIGSIAPFGPKGTPPRGVIGKVKLYGHPDFTVYVNPHSEQISCAYIKAENVTVLTDLATTITRNVRGVSYTPTGDELSVAAVINVTSFNAYSITPGYQSYCINQGAKFRTPRNQVTWINDIVSQRIPLFPDNDIISLPDNSKPIVIGIELFDKDCFDTRGFLKFLRDSNIEIEFPPDRRGERKFSLIEGDEITNFPHRLSTKEFSSMSALIPIVDSLIIDQSN